MDAMETLEVNSVEIAPNIIIINNVSSFRCSTIDFNKFPINVERPDSYNYMN
jgi:hypothetical protein